MCENTGSQEPVRIFYIEINGNFILDLRTFDLRTVLFERITFVRREIGVARIVCSYVIQHRETPLFDLFRKRASSIQFSSAEISDAVVTVLHHGRNGPNRTE
jgi:hypothetical protein